MRAFQQSAAQALSAGICNLQCWRQGQPALEGGWWGHLVAVCRSGGGHLMPEGGCRCMHGAVVVG